jgi:hypothetical protein
MNGLIGFAPGLVVVVSWSVIGWWLSSALGAVIGAFAGLAAALGIFAAINMGLSTRRRRDSGNQ